VEKLKNITVKPRLRLIRGGPPSRFAIGSVDIVVAPEDKPPFKTDAVAYEEDTFLVLSPPVELNEQPESLISLLTELREMKPKKPGSVLMKADPRFGCLLLSTTLIRNHRGRKNG
jgi:hypothetical protein